MEGLQASEPAATGIDSLLATVVGGAVLGKLKSEAFGIGPVLSYRTQWNNAEIFCELKWLHDIEASQRYEGDTILLKVSAEY